MVHLSVIVDLSKPERQFEVLSFTQNGAGTYGKGFMTAYDALEKEYFLFRDMGLEINEITEVVIERVTF